MARSGAKSRKRAGGARTPRSRFCPRRSVPMMDVYRESRQSHAAVQGRPLQRRGRRRRRGVLRPAVAPPARRRQPRFCLRHRPPGRPAGRHPATPQGENRHRPLGGRRGHGNLRRRQGLFRPPGGGGHGGHPTGRFVFRGSHHRRWGQPPFRKPESVDRQGLAHLRDRSRGFREFRHSRHRRGPGQRRVQFPGRRPDLVPGARLPGGGFP